MTDKINITNEDLHEYYKADTGEEYQHTPYSEDAGLEPATKIVLALMGVGTIGMIILISIFGG